MSNNITLAQKYTGILDEYYRRVALTADLEATDSFVRDFDNAGTIKLLELDLHGPGDYNRSTGFPPGSIPSTWRSYDITEDRGVSFNLDVMDSEEGMLRLADVAKVFMRDFMIPEIDAFRFARIAAKSPVGHIVAANLVADTVLTAMDTAIQVLSDKEVGQERMRFYISNTVANLIKNSPRITRNADVQSANGQINRVPTSIDGIPIIPVPASRFNSAITLNPGGVGGWGFVPAVGAKAINFQLVDVAAVYGITRHAKTRMFGADVNQSMDADKFDYRIYHDLIVPKRKEVGLYTHTVA
jgi:hypothetical protein